MDKKYAQEPWTISRNRVCGEGKVICRMETSYTGFGNMSDGKWTSDKDKVKATEKRIVECVNACEGLADPSAVKDMQETLLVVANSLSAWCDSLRGWVLHDQGTPEKRKEWTNEADNYECLLGMIMRTLMKADGR